MENTELKSRYIFIDTQSFMKMGLNFNHPALQSFLELCKNKKLFHLTTTVVKREVESKIQLAIQESLKSLQDFRRRARLLEKIDDENIKPFFKELDEKEIHKKATTVFENFLDETNSKILTANSVNVEEILSLYFEKKAPFADGKKKAEFPDAISLYSLMQEIDGKFAYVISEDSDLRAFCDTNASLINVDTLDKFLDLYNKHENVVTELIKKYLRTIDTSIKMKVKQKIEESWMYNEETWAYNTAPWADSEVVGLNVAKVFDVEPTVIRVDEKECLTTFDVDVDIVAEVTGPDPNFCFYDEEDDRVYVFDTTTQVESSTKTFTVELGLSYDLKEGKLENVEETKFYIANLADGIAVHVYANDNPLGY